MERLPRYDNEPLDRDHDILDHVYRYRLSTPEILHRLFFDDSDRNAVTKVTSRLCADAFLMSHPLYGSNVYFTLGSRGAKIKGLPQKRVKPINPQPLYRDFGVLYFCCRGPVLRERLEVREIEREYPKAIAKGIDSSRYYIDEHGGVKRLSHIWVEGGGAITHIAHKVKQDIIDRRRQVPHLRELIDKGGFAVAIVTLNDDKRLAIIDALRRLRTTVAFRVEVVPELIHLL